MTRKYLRNICCHKDTPYCGSIWHFGLFQVDSLIIHLPWYASMPISIVQVCLIFNGLDDPNSLISVVEFSSFFFNSLDPVVCQDSDPVQPLWCIHCIHFHPHFGQYVWYVMLLSHFIHSSFTRVCCMKLFIELYSLYLLASLLLLLVCLLKHSYKKNCFDVC